MKASVFPTEDGVSLTTPSLHLMHDVARKRFDADPSKCYQRHIRELYAATESREQIPGPLKEARVERITTEEAKPIILKFEWLQSMGSGAVACYGLKMNGELLGVACFCCLGGKIRQICVGSTVKETQAIAKKTICLARGACVPWAPKNAASFLIRNACRQAYKDFGWRVFFAYSDHTAGEVGTVYQACGWYFIGDSFRKGRYHTDYVSADGKRTMSSYAKNHKGVSRAQLIADGWKPIIRWNKKKYVWFEGTPTERATLKSLCRYPFHPYPKRADVSRNKIVTDSGKRANKAHKENHR
jgi:hypothetical protein